MNKFFNTAGPCKFELHYMLPPLDRLPTVKNLLDRQNYFVIQAPRQTGKTTSFLTLAQELTQERKYVAVLLSVEAGSPFSEHIGDAEKAILDTWQRTAQTRLPLEFWPPPFPKAAPGGQIAEALFTWSKACPKPLVIFIDEIDSLQGQTLLSRGRKITVIRA